MSIIHVLPDNISNRIAAGEVVDRPASIVKELVENSIDSGADFIAISIENAGCKLISVRDNGCGMDKDDALLCFEPHATSKIKTEQDIENITTMGFRGEAIPSIASVSRFTLRTRKSEEMEGSEAIVNGGKFISHKPIGCAPGTEIRVSDIFYNVPARRKFLKSSITEEKHIVETVYMLAMANNKVTFELRMDGRVIFSSPADENPEYRLSLLLGRETMASSLKVDVAQGRTSVFGYISKPSFVRNSRRDQRFFINSRPVKSFLLTAAVKDAYHTMIMGGNYPIVTLFIKIAPSEIDVNVHPAKTEIRFRSERTVSTFIRESLVSALRPAMSPAPSLSLKNIGINAVIGNAQVNYELKNQNGEAKDLFDQNSESDDFDIEIDVPRLNNEKHLFQNNNQSSFDNEAKSSEIFNVKSSIPNQEIKKFVPLEIKGCGCVSVIGNLDSTYILLSSASGLIVVDQHAAHERILFEKLLNEFKENRISQKLLMPVTITLSKLEMNFLRRYIVEFENLGFDLEFYGDDTTVISAVPISIPLENISRLVSDILENLLKGNESKNKVNESSIARAACRLALKAHDKLTILESEALISRLMNCELPFSCPHGRPTIINISLSELEKRFGRRL